MELDMPPILYRATMNGCYVSYEEWHVKKETPSGLWLTCGFRRTWRAKTTRFASATKPAALARLKARKQAHLKHIRRRLKQIEVDIRALDEPIDLPGLRIFPIVRPIAPLPRTE